MRWYEIVEATSAEKAAKAAQRRLRANQKLADARRKRMDAGRRYQEQLNKANAAEQDAKFKLRHNGDK